MGRPKAWRKASAALARAAKQAKSHVLATFPEAENEIQVPAELTTSEILDLTSIPSDTEETQWTGGISHVPNSDDEGSDYSIWADSTDDNASISDGEGSDSEASDLERLESLVRHELELLSEPSPYEILMKPRDKKDWKKAESSRGLGYMGNLGRSRRRHEKEARDKAAQDAQLRKTKGADMMRHFVVKKPPTPTVNIPAHPAPPLSASIDIQNVEAREGPYIFTGYLSDIEDDVGSLPEDDDDFGREDTVTATQVEIIAQDVLQLEEDRPMSERTFHIPQPPPLKCRRLIIAYREARQLAQEA